MAASTRKRFITPEGSATPASLRQADASHYLAVARSYIGQQASMAQDTPASGAPAHLKVAYDQPGTWSLKYNGYSDALLRLGLMPASVAEEEARWFPTQENQFGVPLDIRHAYTKADWELWAAAWLRDQPIRDFIIGAVYSFANTTSSRAADRLVRHRQ